MPAVHLDRGEGMHVLVTTYYTSYLLLATCNLLLTLTEGKACTCWLWHSSWPAALVQSAW